MEEYVWISKAVHLDVFAAHAHPVIHRLGREWNVTVTLAGPEDLQDAPFIQAIYDAIARKVAGIMLHGWGVPEEIAAVNAAIEAGIPVVTVDSDVPQSRRLAHVGTDWFHMGSAMADQLVSLAGENGKILYIGNLALANVQTGVRGFQYRMSDYPHVDLLGPEDDAGEDAGGSMGGPGAAEAITQDYLEYCPEISGIAGFDYNSGLGIASALEKTGRAGRVKVVCVDAEAPHIAHIRQGTIQAAFSQRRELFTYQAFQMLYAYNHGSAFTGYRPGSLNISGNVDTGFVIVTMGNVDSFKDEFNLDDAFEHHALTRRLALMSTVVEASGQMTLAASLEGHIVYANPASFRLTGMTEEQVIGAHIDRVFQFTAEHRAQIEHCATAESLVTFETTARRQDATTFPVQLTVSPMQTDVAGRGYVLMAADISKRKRAEEAMRESAEIFRAFVEQSNDAIALTDNDGIVVEWNPAQARLTGISREQALGRPIWIVQSWAARDTDVSEQTVQSLEDGVRRALAGEPMPWLGKLSEITIRHQDGSQRDVQSLVFPIHTQGDRILGSVMRDITERKRIEQTLQEKTDELDRFFSSSLDLLCIANVDGYFLKLSREWEQTLGYRLEDLEGKKFLDLVHPDDLESTLNTIAKLSADQQILNFVNRYRCQDGSYRWIEWRSVPYQSRLIYAAARDITERKEMEESLRQSEQQYRTLFDQSINALVLCEAVVDEQGVPIDFVLLQTNKAFEDSIDQHIPDIVGQRLTHVLPDVRDTPLFDALIRVISTRQPEQLEFYLTSLARYLDLGVFSPHPGQVAISYTDITARKQIDEHKARLALEQEKARILRSFIENVSHEFRTPLAVIRSRLDVLERSAAQPPANLVERIVQLKEETIYIAELVSAMLTMTKLDSVSSLPTGTMDIKSTASQVVEMLQSYAARTGVTLHFESEPEPLRVCGVPDELGQALANIIRNAIQATLPQGEVTVAVSRDSRHAMVEVRDTGIGISDEALPLIFERFYRANTARTGRHAGLGLAIARRIVELHAGHIEVQSRVNEGSIFRVRLPLT